jgi:hypothetical protein
MAKRIDRKALLILIFGTFIIWIPVRFDVYNSLTAILMMFGIVISSYLVERYISPFLKKDNN